MSRGAVERTAAVRRLVETARRVFDRRAALVPSIALGAGLSPEGVELALTRHLELEPTEGDLATLVERAANAERVHVILSANVFVGALRALAVARAASMQVSVYPSRRDPTFARALVEEAADPCLVLTDERNTRFDRGEIHVYGRAGTVEAVRANAPQGILVRAHGPGMGVACVSRSTEVLRAARAVAEDVVPFDQRGCLSPRVVLVEGDEARAAAFGERLDAELARLEARVPRGPLAEDERAEATRYAQVLRFTGEIRQGTAHLVAVAPMGSAVVVPPPGRHVHVCPVRGAPEARAMLAPLAHHIVALGTDDPARFGGAAGDRARISALGAMQRPPLDGPVDLRSLS